MLVEQNENRKENGENPQKVSPSPLRNPDETAHQTNQNSGEQQQFDGRRNLCRDPEEWNLREVRLREPESPRKDE